MNPYGEVLPESAVAFLRCSCGTRPEAPNAPPTEDVFREPILTVSMFNKEERKYLKSQLLARVATATFKGKPNVAPVGFEFDGKYFYIGSIKQKILRSTPRYLNVKNGNRRVALVVDDLVSVDPWRVRGIRVNGVADIVTHEGEFGKGEYIRIRPKISWSWGLSDTPVKTVWK